MIQRFTKHRFKAFKRHGNLELDNSFRSQRFVCLGERQTAPPVARGDSKDCDRRYSFFIINAGWLVLETRKSEINESFLLIPHFSIFFHNIKDVDYWSLTPYLCPKLFSKMKWNSVVLTIYGALVWRFRRAWFLYIHFCYNVLPRDSKHHLAYFLSWFWLQA